MTYEEEYQEDKRKRLKIIAIMAITILLLGIGASFLTGKKSDGKAATETPCKLKVIHDTIYKCPPTHKTSKPIPALTKYKVGDWVCAWDDITGLVQGISWSEGDPNLLQYDVVYSLGKDVNGEPKWGYETFYETVLTAGKCH